VDCLLGLPPVKTHTKRFRSTDQVVDNDNEATDDETHWTDESKDDVENVEQQAQQ